MSLIAASYSVMLLLASHTRPNPPSPRGFKSVNSPKLRSESKSSPKYFFVVTFTHVNSLPASYVLKLFIDKFNALKAEKAK
jgi:hypothetical protein